MLTREEILSKRDLKKEKVNVPEWGGDVFVSEMTAEARDEWDIYTFNTKKEGKVVNASARLVIATVVDEESNRIFTDDDVKEIGKLSAEAINKITTIAQRLNGLILGSVEQAKKNS